MSSVRARGGIFISYRRAETAAQADRLYDNLCARFGIDRVFKDDYSITAGVDFAARIVEDLAGCNVMLALIGRDWPVVTDRNGRKRLENPDDWVRLEIETALQRDIRVIPVLVDGATLPQADDLPPSLRPLIRRQASKLRHGSFEPDVERLIADIDAVIERRKLSRLTVTKIRAPGVDVPVLAEVLRLWYENQGLEAIRVTISDIVMVQCRPRQKTTRVSGMRVPLTVVLQHQGKDLLVEIGSAKWLGRASAAKATAAATGVYVAAMATPLGLMAAGTAAAGMSVWRRQQYRLSNQTISFLRATAPTHVRSEDNKEENRREDSPPPSG
jgi:hypothetical protein